MAQPPTVVLLIETDSGEASPGSLTAPTHTSVGKHTHWLCVASSPVFIFPVQFVVFHSFLLDLFYFPLPPTLLSTRLLSSPLFLSFSC